MDKVYFGTNIKMTKTIAETERFLCSICDNSLLQKDYLVPFVIPSYTALSMAGKLLKDSPFLLGAQNMCWAESGQYTGEISPAMLEEVGVEIIEIGHSERRHIFGETDQMINRKVLTALSHGFTVLLCIGETEQEKESGLTKEVLSTQLTQGLLGITAQPGKIWIAYEPVWAIGTQGKPASVGYVERIHIYLRRIINGLFPTAGPEIPILYGGSVNRDNASRLIQAQEVNGLFVGRAAWTPEGFWEIASIALKDFIQ